MTEAPIVLNARAAVRLRVSGVERWAAEMFGRLVAIDGDRYVTLAPPAALRRRRAAVQAWEQTVLPARAAAMRAGLVLSPANLAPAAWPRNVIVMHDAAVFRQPGAYTRIYEAWHSQFGARVARRALAVITVSEFSRGELVELAGLDRERVSVIHPGVGPAFRPNAAAPAAAAPYVLTVGTDDQRKNLAVLGHTAERLRELGVELAWAGGARSYLEAAPPIPGVRALGYVSEAELPGLYAGARAFVLPSLYEGFGLPCLEAMGCGTPVIASDRGGVPEACGGAALLVDAADGEAVADAVLRVVTDSDLHARLRAAGLQRAAELTWDGAAAATDVLLRQLAGRSR